MTSNADIYEQGLDEIEETASKLTKEQQAKWLYEIMLDAEDQDGFIAKMIMAYATEYDDPASLTTLIEKGVI